MSKLLSKVSLVSLSTLASRLLGLVRDMLTAAALGATVWNSAFITAFTLPNLFRRLLGEGALASALMPKLSDEQENGDDKAVFALLNKTLSWLLVVCIGLILISTLVFISARWTDLPEKWILAANLAIILFPYLLFVCLAAIVSTALNLKGIFGIPALTAVWLNSSIILFLGIGGWLLGESIQDKLTWLCVGVLVGGSFQLLVPSWALFRIGWRPRLDFATSPALRGVLMMMGPGVLGAAVYQINIMISRTLAYAVSDDGATLMYYANRLVELPTGIFSIAISTVVFPAFAKAVTAKDNAAFFDTYRQGIALSIALALPSAAGLLVLGKDIVRSLFEHGLFDARGTEATLPVLYVFAIGLPFVSFILIETRALYALKDMKTPVRIAAWALLLNAVLSLALMLVWGIVGIAVAINFALLLQALLLHRALRRHFPELSLADLWSEAFKSLYATILMAAGVIVLLFVSYALGFSDNARAYLSLFVLIPFGIGIYLFCLMMLGSETARQATNFFKAKLDSTKE